MRYYILDVDTSFYVSLKYTGMNSDSIQFSLVENIEDASKFKYEENVTKYLEIYKNIENKNAEIIEK